MKARIPVSLNTAWQTVSSPSRTFSLGFLTLGGFIAGVMFWGGFNTALEATNRSGARAARIHERYLFTGQRTCMDCHKGIAHRLPNMQGVPPGWSKVSDNPQKPIGYWLADGRGEIAPSPGAGDGDIR